MLDISQTTPVDVQGANIDSTNINQTLSFSDVAETAAEAVKKRPEWVLLVVAILALAAFFYLKKNK